MTSMWLLAFGLFGPCSCAFTEPVFAAPILASAVTTQAQHDESLPFGAASSQIVDVQGQPFAKAVRVEVKGAPINFWEAQISFKNTRALKANDRLHLSFWARSAGGAGQILAKVQEGDAPFFNSPQLDLAQEWKNFEFDLKATKEASPGALQLLFFVGQRIQTLEIGGVELSDPDAKPLPPVVADAYTKGLIAEIQQKYGVATTPVFEPREEAVIGAYHLNGPAIDGAKISTIDAQDQPFRKAILNDVFAPRGENWGVMGQLLNTAPLQKGRTYLLTFSARGRVPGIGGAFANADLGIKYRPSQTIFGSMPVSVGDSWRRFFLPFVPDRDVAPQDLEAVWVLGSQRQQVELGSLALLDAGQTPLDKLPRPEPVKMDYAGRAPDAPWRRAAQERIERFRKGDLKIRVEDAAGKPVSNAQVSAEMTRSAFNWGTSLVPTYDLLAPNEENPYGPFLREKIFSLFNHVAVDIDLKADFWSKNTPEQKEHVLKSLQIIKNHGLTINNGVVVWPGFRTNPMWEQYKDDPTKLGQVVDDFVRDIGTQTAPYVDETVVVNEPYGDREIARILSNGDPTGAPAIAHWFKLMRQMQPHASLWLNEAGLSDNNGRDNARQDYYFNLAKTLIAQKAPLDGIADQAHFSAPVEPEKLLSMWNRFGSLGKKLQVTEFDCKMNDPKLEADFTRDIVTLAFSQPQMIGFTMWGILDQAHWLHYAPLYTAKDGGYELKSSGKAYLDLVRGAWWTKTQGATGTNGVYSLRGFKGNYRVSVVQNGQTQTAEAVIGDHADEIVLKLSGGA